MNVLNQNRPVLKITTKAAKLNIQQRRPKFIIRHSRPKMKVRKKAPQFKINRSITKVKIKKSPVVQISQRFIMEPITYTSRFSDKFLYEDETFNIQDDNLNCMELMMHEANEYIIPEKNVKEISLENINLEWDQGYFEIDWTQNIMDIQWDMDIYPYIQVEPHDIQIQVHNKISRNLKKTYFTNFVGFRVDRRI